MAAELAVARAGAILAVADVERSIAFYSDTLGFQVEATYDDPPYATLSRAGMRLSLAEQGHQAEDRPSLPNRVPKEGDGTRRPPEFRFLEPSRRRDSNPRPPLYESGALAN